MSLRHCALGIDSLRHHHRSPVAIGAPPSEGRRRDRIVRVRCHGCRDRHADCRWAQRDPSRLGARTASARRGARRMVRAAARMRSLHTVQSPVAQTPWPDTSPASSRSSRSASGCTSIAAPQMDRMAGPGPDHGDSRTSATERASSARIVSICWKYWVPLFSIVYRLGNFWNPSRLRQLYSTRRSDGASSAGLFAVAGLYAALVWRFGPFELARIAGAATLLAFVVEDVLHHQPAHPRPDGAERADVASRPTGRSTRNDSRGRCDFHRCCRGWRSISMPTSCITCIRSCPGIDCARFHTNPPTKSAGGVGSAQRACFSRRSAALPEPASRQGSTCDVDGDRSARAAPRSSSWLSRWRAARRRCGLGRRPRAGSQYLLMEAWTFRDRRLLRRQQDAARLRRHGAGNGPRLPDRCPASQRGPCRALAAHSDGVRGARRPRGRRVHGRRAAKLISQAAARHSAGLACRRASRASVSFSSPIDWIRLLACLSRWRWRCRCRSPLPSYALIVGSVVHGGVQRADVPSGRKSEGRVNVGATLDAPRRSL